MNCELCEAAPITERYYEDDECWIAECEACFVPMVVWKVHDPSPPEDVRARLSSSLESVASALFGDQFWIDGNMRTIPDHYHAHARRRFRP